MEGAYTIYMEAIYARGHAHKGDMRAERAYTHAKETCAQRGHTRRDTVGHREFTQHPFSLSNFIFLKANY